MGRRLLQPWTRTVRQMRRRSTEAERTAWRLLRNRGVLGLKFRRQHRVGRVIVDFYCAELRLVLEIDGGYHESAEQQTRDAARDEFLRARGIEILRVPNSQLSEAHLISLIRPRVPSPRSEGEQVPAAGPPRRSEGE